MEKIKVKDKEFALYISCAEIEKQIDTTAAVINTELADKNPLFVVVLNGAFIFAADLLRKITIPCEVNFIRVSSYEGVNTTGQVKEFLGLNQNIENRTVVIVEDIIDTGITMSMLLDTLGKKNPADIRVSSLFVKPGKLQVDLKIDYHCFNIDNDFIVGYGLDYDDAGRNLPDIYKIVE